ncbi:hypothetical protein PC123_g1195 [Phytophthora cactorum]|nr:hypothetical protein PC123_g1195 [Phytophthora cactorum]
MRDGATLLLWAAVVRRAKATAASSSSPQKAAIDCGGREAPKGLDKLNLSVSYAIRRPGQRM